MQKYPHKDFAKKIYCFCRTVWIWTDILNPPPQFAKYKYLQMLQPSFIKTQNFATIYPPFPCNYLYNEIWDMHKSLNSRFLDVVKITILYPPFTKTISNIYDLGLSEWTFKKGFTPPFCNPGLLDIVCTDRFKIFLNSAWFLKLQKLLPTHKNPKYQGQPTFAAFKVFLSKKQDNLWGSL